MCPFQLPGNCLLKAFSYSAFEGAAYQRQPGINRVQYNRSSAITARGLGTCNKQVEPQNKVICLGLWFRCDPCQEPH